MTGKRRPIVAKGHTFLHVKEGERETELNNQVELSLDDDRCAWQIAGLPAGRPETVESASPQVRRHLQTVLSTLAKTQQRRVVRPVPKPASKPKRSPQPPAGLVPCPACNGEGWYGCIVCDGEGLVPAHQLDG